ncbi:MAG TPA: hypothetical protein VND23_10850 [Acidimicrobiales bacterium]|nr:hypothetical protein [Acidimicrobiales bacterium]
MDVERAATLVRSERERVLGLLLSTQAAAGEDREAVNARGDIIDPAGWLTAEAADDAVAAGLVDRLDALDRAEQRLAAGTYGVSLRSGAPIPDERLEADPAAELTVEEAAEGL